MKYPSDKQILAKLSEKLRDTINEFFDTHAPEKGYLYNFSVVVEGIPGISVTTNGTHDDCCKLLELSFHQFVQYVAEKEQMSMQLH